MTKEKLFNLLLILTSLLGYLEWGQGNSSFLFQAEAEVIVKLFLDPVSVLHPFTLLPMFGQVLLLITLFQKFPSKTLTYIAIGCLGLLLLFVFIIGLMSLNVKIFSSTIPFLICTFFTIRHFRKRHFWARMCSSILVFHHLICIHS